jgi:AMP deaminase
MNQKHLLRFIKHKLKTQPDDKVIIRDGKTLTLAEVFQSLNLTPYDLNVDTLDMHADKTFHRFDKFNLKYNPVGESRLREIFLKYSNLIQGTYLAEITQQVFDDLEQNKYQFAEYRISIYGSSPTEWDNLAAWIVDHKLFHHNARWMIQIPRLYAVYKAANKINCLGDMLRNIFSVLFEVSVNPESHPKLHLFLQQCVGFDIVDDESVREKSFNNNMPSPDNWNKSQDPPYSLFAYYIYANLYSLNKLRQAKNFTAFSFRPHAGEAGDHEHLAATFLLAKSINHGLILQKSPALQYLYYLAQIGISMSPLSNNLLFLEYDKNPFPRFFARGLNVTISTDDPLMIHVTKEPLVEEYSVAAQVWKLTSIDMSEIARNSVIQSDFEHRFKAHFLGNNYWLRGVAGNDLRQTNVPAIRVQFRAELLNEELKVLSNYADKPLTQDLVDLL